MLAAPDYKAMYLELFRASEQAARLLQEAQARAEQQLLAAVTADCSYCAGIFSVLNKMPPSSTEVMCWTC